MPSKQQGFAVVELIVGIVILGVIGFGAYMWIQPKEDTSSQTNNQDSHEGTDTWTFASMEECQEYYFEKLKDPGMADMKCQSLQPTTAPVTPQPTETAALRCGAALEDATGAFKEYPLQMDNISLITLGKETNDPRFVYPWIKEGSANIYAPADGILYMIRHKVYEIDGKQGNDYDMFFKVDCKTVYRFNHISDPRPDIKATYPAGDLPSGDYANGGLDIPERVKPLKAIAVKAGESLGSTKGTPTAKNFDFAVGVAASETSDTLAVCPFSVFNEPMKTDLMNKLGPKSGSPQPGYPCDISNLKF